MSEYARRVAFASAAISQHPARNVLTCRRRSMIYEMIAIDMRDLVLRFARRSDMYGPRALESRPAAITHTAVHLPPTRFRTREPCSLGSSESCSLPEASHAMRLTQHFEVENTAEKGETLRKVKPATVRGGDHFARRYQVCAGDTLTLPSYRVYLL